VKVVLWLIVLTVDVEVNVLDATGDRILAGEELTKEAVHHSRSRVIDSRLASRRSQGQNLCRKTATEKRFIVTTFRRFWLLQMYGRADEKCGQSNATFKLSDSRLHRSLMAKFRGDVQEKNACRIYGALEIHKCQGDFHITARGHGYQSFGAAHLDHESMLSISSR
jgi:hypothetical protein